jgi:hypothetical protein
LTFMSYDWLLPPPTNLTIYVLLGQRWLHKHHALDFSRSKSPPLFK